MSSVRYIIIEDEVYAQRRLQGLIEALRPDWELIFSAESVEEAAGYFRGGGAPDLCFMDVELSDGNVFELFKRVRIQEPVIFTTAYDEYSLAAFGTNVVGYVLKPLAKGDLLEVIERYERSWGRQLGLERVCADMVGSLGGERLVNRRILTQTGDRYGFISIADVGWFVSEDKYVFVVTLDGRKVMTGLSSLQDVEGIVSGHDFFRLSRGVICSIGAVGEIHKFFKGRLRVELRAGDVRAEEVVSAARRVDFLNWVGAGSGGA